MILHRSDPQTSDKSPTHLSISTHTRVEFAMDLWVCRAFAIAGTTVWNSLPDDMWDPDVSEDSYRQSLKTFLFLQY